MSECASNSFLSSVLDIVWYFIKVVVAVFSSDPILQNYNILSSSALDGTTFSTLNRENRPLKLEFCASKF